MPHPWRRPGTQAPGSRDDGREVLHGEHDQEPDDHDAEDRVVPALRVVGAPETTDAERDRHDGQHADGQPDDRADALGDPDEREHEREEDVHQHAPAGADQDRLLERRVGFVGRGGPAFGEAQQLAHEPIGGTGRRRDPRLGRPRLVRRNDLGAHRRTGRYVATTAGATSSGRSTTATAPAPVSSSSDPNPQVTPMQSMPFSSAPSTSWSRSPIITTCGPGSMPSSPRANVITSAFVRRPEPMWTEAPAWTANASVKPKCSTMRTAVC